MPTPDVTVLIDTYNHERFIEQAIVSVLEQDFPGAKMEILVVDDGSTDRTPEIVRKFEPRLGLIRKANGGQASAFNAGIPQAQGEVVAFLDGDDWWAPSKLREVVEAFEKNPDIGAVGHGYYRVDLINQKLESVVPERTCRLTLNNAAGARCFMALGGFLAPSMLAVRKRILDRIPPVPQELIFCGDAFIYTLAVAIGGAVVLDRPLSYYCVHGQNLFQTTDPERLRRRSEMTDRCWRELLPWLSKLGLARDANSMLTLAWRLDSEARCLSRQGGKRWRTFQNERARRRLAYRGGSLGYKVFKALSLGLTLLVPPPRFYQLKQWYARKGLGRMREKLGSPVSADLIGIRRHPVENLPSVLTGEISVSR